MTNAAPPEDTTELAVSFDDLTVLSEDGLDVFMLNLSLGEEPPPYYVNVAGRRFAFTARTYLVSGHSAVLPREIREEEAEGRLAILVDRGDRYYLYVHDPTIEAEEADEAEEAGE